MEDNAGLASPPTFDHLVGLPLSIVRRAADMLVLHFGEIVPHHSGTGQVGQIALHIQGPWRLDDPGSSIVGRHDLFEYGGPGSPPQDWRHEDGGSVQDVRFDQLFEKRQPSYGWAVKDEGYVVLSAHRSSTGDLRILFANAKAFVVFPDAVSSECWRLFRPASEHLVFPPE